MRATYISFCQVLLVHQILPASIVGGDGPANGTNRVKIVISPPIMALFGNPVTTIPALAAQVLVEPVCPKLSFGIDILTIR